MKRVWRKWTALLLAICVLTVGACLLPQGARARVVRVACEDFSDVPQDTWYRNYLDAAVRLGLFQGTSETTFTPGRPIFWKEAVTVLGRLAEMQGGASPEGIPEPEKAPFDNVPLGRYYTKYVAWAKEQGFLTGITQGKFQPAGRVTQQELAVLLANFLEGWDRYDPLEDVDLTGVSDWAADAVRAISGYDIFPENHWNPQAPALREECAAFFVRLYERLSGAGERMDSFRKYRYAIKDAEEDIGERFHILSETCADGLYYEFLETPESYYAAEERASQYGVSLEQEPVPAVEQVFENGWKFMAVELQAAGSPKFEAEHCNRFFVDGGGSLDFCCSGLGGGDPEDVTGYVFFFEVPGDTLGMSLYRFLFTEDYNGIPLDPSYPSFPSLDVGDTGRWEQTEENG